jgi:hypothetical protein
MPALNIQDQVMVSLHEALRRRGYAGLLLQTQMYLTGRLDEVALRATLARLSHSYPVVGAHLVRGASGHPPHWALPAEASCPLVVVNLDSDEDVQRYAEQLFATPLDLQTSPIIDFHLLRKPGGCDVVLFRAAHALMDGKAMELLLREVNRFHTDPTATAAIQAPDDPLRQYVFSHPWPQRLRADLALLRGLPLLGFPVQLRAVRQESARQPPRIALRWLDAEWTAICLERVRRLCGFAGVMPVLLAAAYRAVNRVAPRPPGRWNVFYTHAPITQRGPGADQPIFANLQTYVCLQARPAQLGNREALACYLHRQFRNQLRQGFDLGFLRCVALINGRPRLTGMLLRALSKCLTFIFGYHGTVGPGLESFCGTPVERLYSGIPNAWFPPGLSFAAHQYRGCLALMVSHSPERVPPSLVEAFLDAVVEELLPDLLCH